MASSKKSITKKRIKKSDVEQQLQDIREKHKECKAFIARLENTLKLKNIEKNEFEGAILALHQVLTDEKVK